MMRRSDDGRSIDDYDDESSWLVVVVVVVDQHVGRDEAREGRRGAHHDAGAAVAQVRPFHEIDTHVEADAGDDDENDADVPTTGRATVSGVRQRDCRSDVQSAVAVTVVAAVGAVGD
jgi:hypothetical protein